jgi:hypothetical protein
MHRSSSLQELDLPFFFLLSTFCFPRHETGVHDIGNLTQGCNAQTQDSTAQRTLQTFIPGHCRRKQVMG